MKIVGFFDILIQNVAPGSGSNRIRPWIRIRIRIHEGQMNPDPTGSGSGSTPLGMLQCCMVLCSRFVWCAIVCISITVFVSWGVDTCLLDLLFWGVSPSLLFSTCLLYLLFWGTSPLLAAYIADCLRFLYRFHLNISPHAASSRLLSIEDKVLKVLSTNRNI